MSVIGKANYGGSTTGGKQFPKRETFWLKPGDNVFRVLPPFGETAANSGKIAFYISKHKSYNNGQGWGNRFLCNEETHFVSGKRVTTKECPMCLHINVVRAQYEELKASGAPYQETQEFFMTRIFPHDVERRYHLNVMALDGRIGVLEIPSKCFAGFSGLAKDLESKEGLDVSGIETGVFLNFKKVQERPGDKNTSYAVEPYMEAVNVGGRSLKDYKRSPLTPELLERMKNEARDLSNLYRRISNEDIQLMIMTPQDQRPAVVDAIFARGEKIETAPVAVASIPGTTMKAATTVSLDKNHNYQSNSPLSNSAPAQVSPAFAQGMTNESDFFNSFKK